MKSTIALATLLAGCLAIDPTGSTSQSINGPFTDASSWQRQRAVSTANKCTGTKIAPNFVLAAAHCGFSQGETVAYYGNSAVGSILPYWDSATITGVYLPPCVVGSDSISNKTDCSGSYADYAILQLDKADTYGVAATLEWIYPGWNVLGQKVGRGLINGNPNPNNLLMQVDDTTGSSDDSDGSFWTMNVRLDYGDSGGPFYTGGHVLGVASYFVAGFGARYSSVARHLDWILTVIQYRWSGSPPASRYYNGTMIQSFSTTEQVCQYACEARGDCQAYDYILSNGQCQLMTNVSGPASAYDSHYHGALRYAGARSSRTGPVVGWTRDGSTDSIVHVATNGHVHDLFLQNGSWHVEDISGSAPTPSSSLTAYRRSDGSSSVVYRSGNQLIELNRSTNFFDTWHSFNFPLAPGTTPVGDPASYVRADGLSAVLYRTSTGQIIEVSETMGSAGWSTLNISAWTGVPATAVGDPTAYVRSDGYSSVLFRSTDNQIFELYMSPTHNWAWGEPSVLAGAPAAGNKPAGYTHHDGTNAIVYVTAAGSIEELWLDGAGWHGNDIRNGGPIAFNDPAPYVRTDAIEAADYFTWDWTNGGRIFEQANYPYWLPYNLSAYGVTNGNAPMPFVSHDGWDEVAYVSGNHVGVLEHEPGSVWYVNDLTLSTGEAP